MKRKEFGPTKAKKGRVWTHTVGASLSPPTRGRQSDEPDLGSSAWDQCEVAWKQRQRGQRVAWLLWSDLPGSQKQQNSQAPKENLGEIPCLWEFSSLREMPDHPVRSSEACGKGALDWGLT